MKLIVDVRTTIVMNGREAEVMHSIAKAAADSTGDARVGGRMDITDRAIAANFAEYSGKAAEVHGRVAEMKQEMNINSD